MTDSAWLRTFLQRRGLELPDQRPLYAYQCSRDEYIELLHFLRDGGASGVHEQNRASCAAFVLFCAEWYRREYQRDFGWSWAPIWEVLSYELDAMERSRVVLKGLVGYWQRTLHQYESDGSRNFLGSVFSEGGLPFKMLRERDSRFQSLLDRTLKQYDQGHLLGYSTYEQVTQQLKRANLPEVFSASTSVELIAGMADRLVNLVKNYDLTDTDKPVEHLNTSNPKWRESFPIPLDDATGSGLLNSLLTTATNEGKRRLQRSGELRCQHFWSESHPDTLWAQITLPKEVKFHVSSKPATTRFELVVVEGEKTLKPLGPGYAVIDDTSARVRLRNREVMCKRRDSHASLSLAAVAGGVVISTVPIEDSVVSVGDVPLGFERHDEGWRLCGQASFNTKSTDVLLVVPNGAHTEIVDDDDDSEADERPMVYGLSAVRVQGQLQLRVVGEEFFRIRTGQSSGGEKLKLAGSDFNWPTKPELSFKGVPEGRWANNADGASEQGLALYVAGKQPGSGALQELFGTQYVTVRNPAGDALLRRKVGILPSDFRVELHGGGEPGRGSILAFTKRPCVFEIQEDGVTVKQSKHDDHVELELSCQQGFPLINVHLRVTPNLVADPVDIMLPFPNTGCLGFDGNGSPLRQVFSVGDLLGSRLFLFGRLGAPARFDLELTLEGGAAKNAYYRWAYQVNTKPIEVSLYSLREQVWNLLSLVDGIDGVVRLHISGIGGNRNYHIRQYTTKLEHNRERRSLSAERLDATHSGLPRPALMLLHDPKRRPDVLTSRTSEGIPIGEYELPVLSDKGGPWLVVPASEESTSFRPVFLSGDCEPETELPQSRSLQQAVLNFVPRSSTDVFAAVLDVMSTDPGHSGWQFLRALYDHYGYLPLATFEVWKSLMKHDGALVMALFKFDMEPEFLGRIETEFPMLWEFMPVSNLRRAAKVFRNFLISQGIPEDTVVGMMAKWLYRLGDVFPSYSDSLQAYVMGKPNRRGIDLPPEVFRQLLKNWHQDLIRGRSEEQWPMFCGNRLKSWNAAHGSAVLRFDTQMDYRNAVVYLPMFAAAVASGDADITDVFDDSAEAVFCLRQVRDFDLEWFNTVYQYCLLSRVLNGNGGSVDS